MRGRWKGTVLVVDDRQEVCLFFQEVLGLEGYAVAVARSGQEALAALEKGCPDLVFLDLRMPGMDGIETLRRIRAKETGAKVVIVTAHPDLQTAREAMVLGASDYLGNPFDPDLLRQVVEDRVRSPAPWPPRGGGVEG